MSDIDDIPVPITQPFSWQGFSFTVPADWNLTYHHGGPRRGIAALSSLRGKRLEIRWQAGRAKTLQDLYEKLSQRVATNQPGAQVIRGPEGLSSEITEITIPGQRVYLAVTPFRLFECTLPPNVERSLALNVICSMQEFFGNTAWPWQLYGIDGVVSRRFKLRNASLLPGSSHLDFRHYWQNLSLGSFSRADALLSGKSLADFASHYISLLKHHPTPPQEMTENSVRYQIALRRIGFGSRHCLLIEHHPETNAITWRHEW